jgi:hypothetical protein
MDHWTADADAVADLLIEHALECSMGLDPRDALARIEAELGRGLTPSERAQWLDDVATGLEIGEAS